VLLGVPTVGVGKTLFYIDGLTKDKVKQICEQEIKNPNDFALLKGESGRVWGAGLRNGKNATNPVFVSIGTKISLETAIKCVIKVSEFRVPEPVRLADKKSRELIENIDIGNNLHLFKKYDMVYLENL
jgi:deoxyinosine 3'endonuclease (endonuclease V)